MLGEFLTTVSFKDRRVLARYIILNGQADDIIGYRTATQLGIVKVNCDNNPDQDCDFELLNNTVHNIQQDQINAINLKTSTWIHSFTSHPELFSEKLGLLKNHLVNLQVDSTAKPIQQPAYPVPFGLLEMTKAKLDFLVTNGIISKATDEKPTWISPLHPVAKLDAKNKVLGVRITSNAKQLNKKLVKVKRHIPTITELTNDLAGSE